MRLVGKHAAIAVMAIVGTLAALVGGCGASDGASTARSDAGAGEGTSPSGSEEAGSPPPPSGTDAGSDLDEGGIVDADADAGGEDAGLDASDAAATATCVDQDGDGYGVGAACTKVDCNDLDPLVHPGMQEIADDGLDNDCSGGDLTAAAGPGRYVDGSSQACTDVAPGRGTKATPYCTIEKAVLDSYQVLPATAQGEAFFVAKGQYPLVLGIPKSIRLYGGYDGSTWAWDPKANATVIGGSPWLESSDGKACRLGPGCSATCVCVDYTAWISVNADANAVVSGFTVAGGARPGAPIFAVIVNSSGKVTLAHDDITAGSGVQTVTVQIPASATDVRLLHDRITGGTPSSSTVFAVNNLGSATLFGNTISVGPAGPNAYGAAVQNYGEMRLAANVLNPGAPGATLNATYGLINAIAQNPPNPPTKGQVWAVNNVIFGGQGVETSIGVFNNGEATLVNNVIGDRTSTPLAWSKRPNAYAVPLWVGFASKTHALNNALWNLTYSDEVAGGDARRHLFAHTSASTAYLETATEVNQCTWFGCQTSADNLAVTPAFVNAASDFHLAGSALAGKGTATGPHITGGLGHLDIDRQLRPLGGGWDIGVDEVP